MGPQTSPGGAPSEEPLPDDDLPPEPPPPWIRRVPWSRIGPIAMLLVFWLLIGLVCTPRYFRF